MYCYCSCSFKGTCFSVELSTSKLGVLCTCDFLKKYDQLIESPWNASIITAPAPNRGQVIKNMTGEGVEKLILDALVKRIDMILSIAIQFGHRHLVLGAWGCGVFKNDPVVVAELFKSALLKKSQSFDTVIFAVLDYSRECKTFNSFHEAFASFPTE